MYISTDKTLNENVCQGRDLKAAELRLNRKYGASQHFIRVIFQLYSGEVMFPVMDNALTAKSDQIHLLNYL